MSVVTDGVKVNVAVTFVTETTAGVAEVDDPLVEFPAKPAVTLFDPAGRLAVANVAVPFERVA